MYLPRKFYRKIERTSLLHIFIRSLDSYYSNLLLNYFHNFLYNNIYKNPFSVFKSWQLANNKYIGC